MPHSPSENGRGSSSRAGEDEFVLYLQGIPAHCRWQELKDFIRQTASHVRQAVVYDDRHGCSTGLGQIIVKNEDEAWRTYRRLSATGWEGQTLIVTLARASLPTKPIAGPMRSQSGIAQSSYLPGYSSSPGLALNPSVPASPISSEPVMSPMYQTPEALPTMSCRRVAINQYIPVTFDPVLHQLPLSENAKQTVIASQPPAILSHAFESGAFEFPPYQVPVTQPAYEGQSHKEPAIYYPHNDPCGYNNTQDGTSYPDYSLDQRVSRHLTIRNINPSASYQKLKEHLRTMGVLEQCEMPENYKFQRRKGYSKISFRTEEDAKHAASLLDDSVFMGMKIQVAFEYDVEYDVDWHQPNTTEDHPGRRSGDIGNNVLATPLASKTQLSTRNATRRDFEDKTALKKISTAQPFVVNGSTGATKCTGVKLGQSSLERNPGNAPIKT
jgi:RNA recognition motif-containing protein